ncbi:MAG: preprotein translocase subunit YajC [Gaiellales bacterium]
MAFLIIIVVMFAVMYFLAIRPQQKRQRAAQDMLSRLAPGDEIVTVGGVYGDVIEVHDDRIVLEIAEDVQIEVARRAIAQIVPPEVEEPVEPAALETVVAESVDGGSMPEPVREEKRWGGFGKRSG